MSTTNVRSASTPAGAPSALARSVPLIIAAGCIISVINLGERSAFGLFLTDMTAARGWSREAFSLALAIQNLVWGAAMPFAGALADRYGTARVLAAGGLIYAAAMLMTAWAPTPLWLQISLGGMAGLGIAASSFTIVLARPALGLPRESPQGIRPGSRRLPDGRTGFQSERACL
jgi:MFS family permease